MCNILEDALQSVLTFFFKENEQTKQKHRVAKRDAIHGTNLSFLVPAHHIFVHQLAVLDIE